MPCPMDGSPYVLEALFTKGTQFLKPHKRGLFAKKRGAASQLPPFFILYPGVDYSSVRVTSSRSKISITSPSRMSS